MREESTSDFMNRVVVDHDPHLYSVWETGQYPHVDMSNVFRMMVMKLFVSNEQGRVADYVRELALHQINGALFWKP